MRRSNCRYSLVFLGSSLLAAIPGCGGSSKSDAAHDAPPVDKPLFLVGALDVGATQCVAQSNPNGPLLAAGTLDLAFGSSYSAVLVIGNTYANPGASASKTDRVTLRGADITLETPDGTVIDQYSTIGTGFIDAATGSAAYGSASIPLLPATVGATDPVQNAKQVIAKIRVRGEALDGTALNSNELDFPINVCTGCLVRYPPSAADPTATEGGGYKCSTAAPLADEPEPAPCIMGQDAPFSCTLCAAAYSLCRDPSLNPSLSQ